MINRKDNKYSLELAHNFKASLVNTFSYEFSPVLNQIMNITKNSPIYLIDPTPGLKDFAMSLKESATELQNEITALLAYNHSKLPRKYVCNAPSHLSIRMLSETIDEIPYTIHITQVASGQINKSSFVSRTRCPFQAGTYSFNILRNNCETECKLHIENSSTNLDIFNMLKNEIEKENIGLSCFIEEEGTKISLSIHANANKHDNPSSFQIKDKNSDLIRFYKLTKATMQPSTSSFSINGEETSSFGTVFLIDDLFEITLLNSSAEDIVIYTVPEQNAIGTSIHKILNIINYMLKLSYQEPDHKLEQELINIILQNKEALTHAGITLNELNYLSFSEQNLSLFEKELDNLYLSKDSFAPTLLNNISKVSINPMEYVPKKVVSYPDNSKIHFCKPYITSMYSGFIYSGYC